MFTQTLAQFNFVGMCKGPVVLTRARIRHLHYTNNKKKTVHTSTMLKATLGAKTRENERAREEEKKKERAREYNQNICHALI